MLVEKQKIQQCFNKAAATYDQAAILQHQTGKKLLSKLKNLPTPATVLDIGAGTGYCTHLLAEQYPHAELIGLDFAVKMLETAQKKSHIQEQYLCADFDNLPLKAESIDLAYSNFSLQWSLDLGQTLVATKAVLKDQGYLAFSTLGPATLHELRDASKQIDAHHHANQFLSLNIIQNLLTSQFNILELTTETQILQFDDIFELMHNLKEVGANHVFNKDSEGLGSKHYFNALTEIYEHYRNKGKLPATYEIIYGVAQK
jgi:malonyl-CoA O-methyltransferase